MRRIKIKSKMMGEIVAELLGGKNPKTVESIWSSLPIKGRANTWGDEIYFSIGADIKREDAQQVVAKGDIGY